MRAVAAASATVAAFSLGMSARGASAEILIWDPTQVGTNGNYGPGSDAPGTWDATNPANNVWFEQASGNDITWNNSAGYTAAFGSDPGYTSGYTVTLGSAITATGVIFANNPGYTIAGGGYSLNIGSGGVTVMSGVTQAETISAPVILGASQTWNNSAATGLTVSGVISGVFGLTVASAGTGITTLSGSNTFTGGLTVNSGTVVAGYGAGYGSGATGSFGAGVTTVNAGGTIQDGADRSVGGDYVNNNRTVALIGGTWNVSSNNDYIRTINLSGGSIIGSGAGYLRTPNTSGTINSLASSTTSTISVPIRLTYSSLTLNVADGPAATDLTLSGAIQASDVGVTGLGITKTGPGTFLLSGTSTYTGPTILSGGVLTLGTTGLINGSSALTLGGTTQGPDSLQVAAGNPNTQAFASTAVATGASNIANGATTALALKAITRSVGGVLDVGSTSAGGGVTTTTGNTVGILGGYLTTDGGAAFGTNNGSGVITAYAGGTLASTAGTTAASYTGINVDVDSSQTQTAAITPNSLRFINSGNTLTLATGTVNTVTSGGILITPSVGSGTANISGGTLTGPSGVDLIVNQSDTTAGAVIASVIANPSTTATAFTKAGAGTLTLTGANTYSGTTYVDAGTLIANAKATVDTNYVVAPGAVLDIGYTSVTLVSGPSITVNGNGVGSAQVAFKAGVKYSVNGGLILQGAPTTITSYGTGANPQIFGYDTNATQISVAATASGSVLSSTVSPATYDYGLVISTVAGANTATGDLIVNGPIVNNGVYSGDGLNKKGTGSLLLTAASTYVYSTSILGGSIIASTVSNVLPTADSLSLGSGTTSGQLLLSGIAQQVSALAVSGTGTTNAVVGNSATTSALTVSYATTTAADAYTGLLGGTGVNQNNLSLTKAGVGAFNVSGSSTYTGGTFVTGGILEPINTYSLPGQTTPGSINASSGGTLLLAVGNAAPQFQSADVTNVLTNANFSSGSAIGLDTTFAGTTGFAYTSGIAGVENVLLTGAYNGSIGGAIATGAGTLLKTGLGTWTLNGADSFTGLTNVSSGTLVVNGDAGQAHSYLVAAGALLQLGYSSGGYYSGSITVNGGGVSNASSGVVFKGGVTFGTNGGFVLQTAPTTVTTYGTGTTTLSGFDVHSTFLTVANTASGSVFTSSLNFSTGSYGYTVNVASGANTATGDLTIAGSIIGTGNDSSQSGTLYAGLDKSGAGSLLLTGASTYAAGTAVTNGSIILSGGNNLLPIATSVQLGLGTNSGQLLLSGINQQVGSILAAGTGTANAILGNSATASTLTVTPTALDTYNGSIGGVATNANNLALAVTGTSILAVTGSNTYTGGTSVTGATLRVNNTAGSGTGTGPVTVAVGGTLGGSGNASGGITVLGTITGGNSSSSIGTLTTGPQNWNTSGGSGVYLVKVSADGTTNDRLVMSNLTVSASPMAKFTINLSGTAAGSLTGTPVLAVDVGGGTPASDPFTVGSLTLQVNGAAAPANYGLSELPDTTLGGVDLVLTTAAPEPASLLMLAAVVAPGLLGRRRAARCRA